MSTRSQCSANLMIVSNEELARIERENNRTRRRDMAGQQDPPEGLGDNQNLHMGNEQEVNNPVGNAGGGIPPRHPAQEQRRPNFALLELLILHMPSTRIGLRYSLLLSTGRIMRSNLRS